MSDWEKWLFLVLKEVVMDSGVGSLDGFTAALVCDAYRELREKWLLTPDGQLWSESVGQLDDGSA